MHTTSNTSGPENPKTNELSTDNEQTNVPEQTDLADLELTTNPESISTKETTSSEIEPLPDNNINTPSSSESSFLMKKPKKSNVILVAISVIVFIFILASLISIMSGGYKKPIKSFCNSIEKTDVEEFKKSFPESVVNSMDNEQIESKLEDLKEYLEDDYGDNLRINVEFMDKLKVEKEERKTLEDNYNVTIDKAYEVCFKISIKGKDDKASRFCILYVAKVDGDWVLLNGSPLISNISFN